MGTVGLNGAAAILDDPMQRGSATNAGWGRWAPVNAVAIGATAATGYRDKDVRSEEDVPLSGATEPSAATPPATAATLPKLRALQWVVPALMGAIVATSATVGEQQRPAGTIKGSVERAGTATRQAARHPRAAAKNTAALLCS